MAAGDDIYRTIVARLGAHELLQHYAPLFNERLHDAHAKFVAAVVALQQLQEIHESVVTLNHPQSQLTLERTANVMPLVSGVFDIQQQLADAIKESMDDSSCGPVRGQHQQESPRKAISINQPNQAPVQQQSMRKRARSPSPPFKLEFISSMSAEPHHVAKKPVYEIDTRVPQLLPQNAVTLNFSVSDPRSVTSTMSTMPARTSPSSSMSIPAAVDKPRLEPVAIPGLSNSVRPTVATDPRRRSASSSESNKPALPPVAERSALPRPTASSESIKPADSAVAIEKYSAHLKYTPTNVRDDGKILLEHLRRCTHLMTETRSMRTLRERQERLPQLVAELVRALQFVADIESANYWNDVDVHANLDTFQNCIHKSITVILDNGTYDQICSYLSSLSIEVSYLVARFGYARDVFIGNAHRLGTIRHKRKYVLADMEKVESDWKAAASDARRARAVEGPVRRNQLLEVTLKDLIALFMRMNADLRAADRFLGEDDLINVKKVVEKIVDQITENPKCDAETSKLRSKFLAAMIRATLQFERLGVQLRRSQAILAEYVEKSTK